MLCFCQRPRAAYVVGVYVSYLFNFTGVSQRIPAKNAQLSGPFKTTLLLLIILRNKALRTLNYNKPKQIFSILCAEFHQFLIYFIYQLPNLFTLSITADCLNTLTIAVVRVH